MSSKPKTRFLSLIALFVSGTVAMAAGPQAVERVLEERIESEHHSFRLVQLVEDLHHPWALGWLPDGSILITERLGSLYRYHEGRVHEVEGVWEVAAELDQRTAPEGGNQGGLLDLVVHPDYAENGWIYFTYSSRGDPDSVTDGSDFGTGTAVARARLNEAKDELVDKEVLYVQEPLTNPGRHYGSRMVFPGDGTLVFSIGDSGLRYTSQDLTHPSGSMIRILEDGGAPEDNPFVGVAPGNLRPEIFSFGHRNNQGLAIDPATGSIWASGHGPSGGDLLYLVERGRNYGWPQVSFGKEYRTGAQVGIGRAAPGVTPPNHFWENSMAPSGLTFYSGDAFPEWKGNIFAGFLLAERVHRITLEHGVVVEEEPLLNSKIGRVRDVREGPDGLLYFATDQSEGGLYRIEPL